MAWLFTWLWQGVAVALVVSLLLRAAQRLNASTRHVIWWTTLVVVLALPALGGRGAVAPASLSAPGPAATAAPLVATWVIPAVPDWVLSVLIGGWLGVVLVRVVHVARSFVHLRQLKRGCRPMPAGQERGLTGWIASRGDCPRAALGLSDEVVMPSALGLGRPVIVLPSGLAADLDAEDLDRIVLHELAHLVRRDDWTRFAQAAIESVAGLHPAVWWIGRKLDLEREAACDDFVVSRTGEALRYASSLAAAAERAMSENRRRAAAQQALAPGAARAGRALVQRVTRLVDRRRGHRPWSFVASLGTSAFVAFASLMVVTPLSTFVSLVDAAPGRSVPQMILASQVVLGDISGSMPGVLSRPVAVRREEAAARRAEGSSARPEPELVDLSVSASGVSVDALPADAPLPSSSVLSATPIAERLGGGGHMGLPDVPGRQEADRAASRGPWQDVAGAGAALGAGVKNAGLATAGFFTRAGSSIARVF